jgi:hypothetical protein
MNVMRKIVLGLSLLVMMWAGRPAYATTDCNGASYICFYYIDYSPENLSEQKSPWDCWTLGSGLSPAYMADTTTPGFEVTGYGGQASRTFTVPANNTGHFEVMLHAEISDPNHSSANILYATAIVYHPGTGYTWHDIYYHNASQGDDSSNPYVELYNVAEGDTITVSISGGISFLGGHVRFTTVHIFYDYF